MADDNFTKVQIGFSFVQGMYGDIFLVNTVNTCKLKASCLFMPWWKFDTANVGYRTLQNVRNV